MPKPRHLDAWGAPPTYHGYQGGDLIGVVEHLDYLVSLGVTAVYFTPVFQSASQPPLSHARLREGRPDARRHARAAKHDRCGP